MFSPVIVILEMMETATSSGNDRNNNCQLVNGDKTRNDPEITRNNDANCTILFYRPTPRQMLWKFWVQVWIGKKKEAGKNQVFFLFYSFIQPGIVTVIARIIKLFQKKSHVLHFWYHNREESSSYLFFLK